MAKFDLKPNVNFEVKVTLTEEEANALWALSCYGTEEFLNKFYDFLGKTYIENYANGLRTLFKSCQNDLEQQLQKISSVRGYL